jgi:preprotein translocase subunit SecD
VATTISRPWRTLAVFLLVIALMYAAAAALGSWKPHLGLDLQGGTRITLQARAVGGGSITEDKLDEAVGIISNRVNGAGVAEAEVTTQGDDIIIVEVPGQENEELLRTIGSTAQLRFRLVSAMLPPDSTQTPVPSTPTGSAPTGSAPTDSAPTGTTPETTGGTTPPTVSPGTGSSTGPKVSPGATTKNRVAPGWAVIDETTTPADQTTPAAETTAPADDTPTGESPAETGPTTGAPTELQPPDLEQIDDPYAWTQSPPAEWQVKLQSFRCGEDGVPLEPQRDLPTQPLLACDEDGGRYLLGPAMVEGTDVTDASAGIPQNGVNYVVQLEFNDHGADQFGEVTTRIAGTGRQLAIVLDGMVLSAPTNDEPITGGQAEISGGSENPFTQEEAESLANSLRYGALPLTFVPQQVTSEGPELASNQLYAGIVAGIIGLVLVVVYCLLYYRGLGIVVVASLIIAGLMTYAAVLLLGEAYGFTLTLPGIAGLIVAVGITADSFIVYFERLRDEVRDGKTLRTAVETGWQRARLTILAADTISLLAAVVLFIFAIGAVKGFAFALGLATVIDIFVVFFFTKPMVTLLARTKFFGQGHKLSGLDRGHLGLPERPRTPQTVGGEA